MKKTASCLLYVLVAASVFPSALAFADLGLKQMVAGQGASAVGPAILAAAKTVYANHTDPAVIKLQLIDILNEAAATGDEQVARYAIVSVMMAGGVEHLALSRDAINNSDIFKNYPELTAATVEAAEVLMTGETAGGAKKNKGGGGGSGDDEDPLSQGGADPQSQGGGSGRLFPWEIDPNAPFNPNPFSPTAEGGDGDKPATGV